MNVASFYRFIDIADPAALRPAVRRLCERHALLGTVLLAGEGINGTLTGEPGELAAAIAGLGRLLGGADLAEDCRCTRAGEPPFRRLRVKLRAEIVTLGRPDLRPQQATGRHVPPEAWNELIERPGTLVIDTRNRYEVEIGSFPGALDPGTDSFREFPRFAESLAGADRERPVAMFCTGGIRCEKAAALMLEQGFREVYQLQGGILNYLERMQGDESRWRGECFVFDSRVAVDRDLAEGAYVQCHACRRPLSAGDLESPDYREGVSCPHCIHELEASRAARLEERRRQVVLARRRGEAHIGAVPRRAVGRRS